MSLLFPAYLLGLLGLLLPWVLHRFSNHKPEEQLFPSGRFLEATKPPVSRTRMLKYRTLMTIRMLSVLLLCFLFAQPWMDSIQERGETTMHHVIAIDLSLSMHTGDRWGNAMVKGRELIDQYGDDNSVDLIAFDQTLVRVANNTISKTDLVQGLNTLRPGFVAADYGVLMQRLNKLAAQRSEPVKVWIITDQQLSAMPAQRNALYAPEVAEFELVSTVLETQRNVHLRAQARSGDGVNVQVVVQLTASTAGLMPTASVGTAQELIPSTVTVSTNGREMARQTVKITSTGTESLVFDNLSMPMGALPRMTISLEGSDSLLLDNTVTVVINQPDPTEIASLQIDSVAEADAFVFIATALETDSQARVIAVAGTAERIAPAVLHLVSGRSLSQKVLDLDIRQFVDDGKNALLFTTDNAAASTTPTLRGTDVGFIDESHQMSLGDIEWYGTEFYEVPVISLQQGDRVLLETTQRQAILVERKTARGKILLLNDRLDGQSSNLPFQPSFVVLMKSILDYFDTSTALPDLLIAGERLLVSGNVQLLDPDDNSLLSFDESERPGGIALNEPGLYKIIGSRGTHFVNVQLDANEADITLVSSDALSNWRKRFADRTVSTVGMVAEESVPPDLLLQDSQAQRLRAESRSRSRLWLWLLPTLAVVLVLETLLANRRLDVRRDGS